MGFIKSLYYAYKVKAYESAVRKLTKARMLLKEKQAECTAKQEKYRGLLNKSLEV